ncbi:MAG: biotin/lipoyl-binding protein [Bacteroidaceae bacterium]|nr:biotin/lipoyl-binding protein [Bacteroidaceae bacterium]
MKEYKFKIGEKDYTATVEETETGALEVTVDGKIYKVELPDRKPAPKPVVKPAVAQPAAATAAPATPKPAAAGGNTVTAPLNGKITQVLVKVGDTVKAGDTVVMLEAMKMENSITAEFGGTVKSVLVNIGDQVDGGQGLVELA